jgi:predicted metal-dependent peptidase
MSKVSKLDKARAQIVLDHPFFASILLRRPLVMDNSISTLAVDARGKIYYNEKFVESLTVPQLVWGLCHEVGHVIGQHALRKGTRDAFKWNYAGDAWINDMLDDAGVGQRIPKTVDMPGSKDDTVENIYDKIPDNDGSGNGDGDADGDGAGGADGMGQDIIYGDGSNGGKSLTADEMREVEGQLKVEIAEAAQAAKMRGKMPGKLAEIVADILDVKTPWYEILERHCTARVQQGQSWRRPNKRFVDVYMPSTDKLPQMGELVVQIDVSGSISQTELAYYNGHLSRIVEQCRPSKTHVLYVDTAVQRHDEFDTGEEIKLEFFSGGGTDMPAGFEYLAEQGISPDVMVVLTDGYTGFGEDPGYPVVWCISSEVEAPWGENVHFEMEL